MPAVHLIIKGKVQGVFFRATAKDIAEQMNIGGWARNTSEGAVEIVASGTQPDLDRYTEWCRSGPSKAIVTEVIVTTKHDESFEGFRIVR